MTYRLRLSEESVRKVQMQLTSVGFPPGPIDGKYGDLTRAAVKGFQRKAGLLVDGLAGKLTRDALDIAVEKLSKPAKGIVRDGFSRPVWPVQADVEAFFGKPGENQTLLSLPYDMRLAWDKSKKISRISCHEKVADPMRRVLERVADHYGVEALPKLGLDLFGGCLNVRKMRGGNAWSMHSWGIAIDIDPARNQLRWGRARAELAKPIYSKWFDLWEEEGAVSLGRERNYDWMHVQFARLY